MHSSTRQLCSKTASWEHQCSFERFLTSSRSPLRAHRQASGGEVVGVPAVTMMMVIDRRSGPRDAQRRRRHERIRHAGQESSHRCQRNTPRGRVCRHVCRQLAQRATEYTQIKRFPPTTTEQEHELARKNENRSVFATREFHRLPVWHSSSNTT